MAIEDVSHKPRPAHPPQHHVGDTRLRHMVTARRLLYVFAGVIYTFLFLPVVVVAITSVNPAGVASFPPAGFTAEWYSQLAGDQRMLSALRTSLLVAVLTAAITCVLGLAAAYGLSRYSFRYRRAVQALFFLPMLVPGVVIGISLIIWFNRIGISSGFLTILIAHVVMSLPFAVVISMTSFHGFDPRLEEASQDLGANEWRTFRNITLPLVLPGVIGSALIAFTISFDEFVVTFFVAGGGVVTLPIEIFSRIRFTLSPVINAVATLVLTVSILLIAAGQLASTRRHGNE